MVHYIRNFGIGFLIASFFLYQSSYANFINPDFVLMTGAALLFISSLIGTSALWQNKIDINTPNVYLYQKYYLNIIRVIIVIMIVLIGIRNDFFIRMMLFSVAFSFMFEPITRKLTNNYYIRIDQSKIIFSEDIPKIVNLENIKRIDVIKEDQKYKLIEKENNNMIWLNINKIRLKDREKFLTIFKVLIMKYNIEMNS